MNTPAIDKPALKTGHWLILMALCAMIWWLAYLHLDEFAQWVVDLFGLSRKTGYSFGRFTGTALTWLVFMLMALAGLWLALR